MTDTIVLIIVGFVLSVAGFSIALRGARTKSALYKAAINVVRDGVVIINRNGRIVDLNYSAQRVIGHPDIVGKSLEAIRPEWSDLVSQEQREAGEEVVVENGNRKRTYNFNTYSLEDTRTHDGNRIVIMSDLTDKRQIENELKKARDACRLMEIKDRFISSVTHELRTPLVSVKGYLDYIMSEDFGPIPAKIKSNLMVVRRNADQLLNLTNDLLDIRRIEAGKLQLALKIMNFSDVVRSCFVEIRPFVGNRNQTVYLDIPEEGLPIIGDAIRLNQVLMNLLINASKFTGEKGQITIGVTEGIDVIEVRVIDTGIGIREEDLERVFEPFATIQKPTYIKGTGLGLSVSRGLVETHGGRIWAESPGEGKGSTFVFTLPKRRPVPWEVA